MASLFEIKNSFYLGSFNQTINEAQNSSQDSIEKDQFLYRAYIAKKKYNLVTSEIRNDSPSELLAVRKLAEYFASDAHSRHKIVSDIDKQSLSFDSSSTMWPLVSAIIYLHENNLESALKSLHNVNDLECLFLTLQIYLKMDRLDLATKILKKMSELDDDSTLTQLATATLNFYLGQEKLNEAYYIYQELIDKYGESPLLLNGIAAAMICLNRIEESETFLQQALGKNSDQPETLINMMFLTNYLGKQNDLSERYLTQLKDSCPNHELLNDCNDKMNEYDRLTQLYLS